MVGNNEEYSSLRKKLCRIISKINSVANIEGKGRDDLTCDILIAAEGLIRRVSLEQSRAVCTLADKIRSSYLKLR